MKMDTLSCLFLCLSLGVFGTDAVKTLEVIEGDPVTLSSQSEIPEHGVILWKRGPESSATPVVMVIQRSYTEYDRFRGRLLLDNKTGSLTITNTRISDSEFYTLQISTSNREGIEIKYRVIIYARLPIPVINRESQCPSSERSSDSKCVLVCSVMNVTHCGNVTLSWYAGISVLSSISVCDLNISLIPLEVEYQDNNTYRCVINNPITHQTTHLDNITQLCHRCAESPQTPFLLVSLLLMLLLLVVIIVSVVLFFCRRRKYTQAKQDAQSKEEEVDYTDATFIKHRAPDTETDGRDQTLYSEVVLR